MANKSVQCIRWHGAKVITVHKLAVAKTNRPALILEVTPCNVGAPFGVSLLPHHHGKGSLTLGIFRCLGKAAIIFNLDN